VLGTPGGGSGIAAANAGAKPKLTRVANSEVRNMPILWVRFR
jgi:hypothetical protein